MKLQKKRTFKTAWTSSLGTEGPDPPKLLGQEFKQTFKHTHIKCINFHWFWYKSKDVYASFAVSVPKIWWLWGKQFSSISFRIRPCTIREEYFHNWLLASSSLKATPKFQKQMLKCLLFCFSSPGFCRIFDPQCCKGWGGTWLKSHKGNFAVTFSKSPLIVKKH